MPRAAHWSGISSCRCTTTSTWCPGIAEFATLTTAAVIAWRRTRHDGTRQSRIYSGVVSVLLVGYPLLGLVYLTDRLGTLVEPVFFVAFSVMVLAEVFEPSRARAVRPRAGRDRAGAVVPDGSGQDRHIEVCG